MWFLTVPLRYGLDYPSVQTSFSILLHVRSSRINSGLPNKRNALVLVNQRHQLDFLFEAHTRKTKKNTRALGGTEFPIVPNTEDIMRFSKRTTRAFFRHRAVWSEAKY
jgi:hypothetical protein